MTNNHPVITVVESDGPDRPPNPTRSSPSDRRSSERRVVFSGRYEGKVSSLSTPLRFVEMAETTARQPALRQRKSPPLMPLMLLPLVLLMVLTFFFFSGSSARPPPVRGILLSSSAKILSPAAGVANRTRGAGGCDPSTASLRVFMYDLPPEFHFGLLDWSPDHGGGVWPDVRATIPVHPGGLNLQHSAGYWLTLDLLSSRLPDRPGPCTAVRVDDARAADVVFVPFFSSLSVNRHSKPRPGESVGHDKALQEKLVQFLAGREEWKRFGGQDHIVLAHHPNSMLDARTKLWPCMFILADFGRYSPNVANVEKDVVAPYKHVVETFVNDSAGFDDRPTLLFFQGAIYRKDGGYIRQELFYLLKGEKDVHFSFGSIGGGGISKASQGMHTSKFCLNIAGDTPSSNRLFDAIASHCVPVIISDEIELPYEDVLDYSKFCIFVRTSDALKEVFLMKLIRGITRKEWTQMYERLKEVARYFEFQYPSEKDDAVQMIWQAVARKVPSIRLKLHRAMRFSRYEPTD